MANTYYTQSSASNDRPTCHPRNSSPFFERFNQNTHDSATPEEKHLNLTLQHYLNLI
jgi:hypothetical protein